MGGLFLQSCPRQKLKLEAGLSPEFQDHFGKQRGHIAKEEEEKKKSKKVDKSSFFHVNLEKRS